MLCIGWQILKASTRQLWCFTGPKQDGVGGGGGCQMAERLSGGRPFEDENCRTEKNEPHEEGHREAFHIEGTACTMACKVKEDIAHLESYRR